MKMSIWFAVILAVLVLLSPSESPVAPHQLAVFSFNWMGNEFSDKPFLEKNIDGRDARVGFLDINLDGKDEIILEVSNLPRGVPAVEIFKVAEGGLQSIGGFFAASGQKLAYYRDARGRLLFLQEAEAGYGGTTKTLIATYVADMHSVPICAEASYYGETDSEGYYVFPEEGIDCTTAFLWGDFHEEYAVSKAEYDRAHADFLASLTWVEDVAYSYTVSYQMYNNPLFSEQLRHEEPVDGQGDFEWLQTAEEYKKTSDLVAAALCEQPR